MTDLSSIEDDAESLFFNGHYYKELIIGNRRVYRCSLPICEKTFRFKSEMKRHIASHSSLRPFTCVFPYCAKTFKREDALNNHLRLHNQSSLYCCSEEKCGCSFVSKSALNYHLLTHNGEKIYECNELGCDRAFTTLGQLKQHMKAYNYHRRLKALSLKSDSSLSSNYSPDSESNLETGSIIVMPVIKYKFCDISEQANKRLKGFDEDLKDRGNILQAGSFESFNYLKTIYGKPVNEDPEISLNSEFLNKIFQLNIRDTFVRTETERKFYNALKSLLEEDNLTCTGSLVEAKRKGSFQSTISTMSTVDTSACANEGIESIDIKIEDFPDFEAWLEAEGRDNLYSQVDKI